MSKFEVNKEERRRETKCLSVRLTMRQSTCLSVR
jgi:hypothetical protein